MAFNGRFLLRLIQFATERGARAQDLLILSGHSEQALSQADCQVSDEAYNAVASKAIAQTGDKCFGLHLGENQNLSAMGLVGQITQTSETIRQALEYCCHFANLGCSKIPMALQREADYYALTFSPDPIWASQAPQVMRHTVEGNIAFTIREFSSLTHKQFRPVAVQFPWKSPACVSEYERIFNCPLQFRQSRIAILLHLSQVEAPIITADFNLLRILVSHAEAKAAQLRARDGFHVQLKQTMLQLLNPQLPTLHTIATQFNCSPRTLQRRLAKEKYTFQQLTDELRQELALSYLQRPDLSLGDIAYLLHYSDQSAFSRAFKRWMGQSPQAYQKSKV